MNRILKFILIMLTVYACNGGNGQPRRVAVAKAGERILYVDEIPMNGVNTTNTDDSTTYVQNYINKWAKRELLFQKASANLSHEQMEEIDYQVAETKRNLVVHEYQSMMMIQKMDTVILREEMERYYKENEEGFILTSNIVKALFIKLPVETPEMWKFRSLIRSDKQKDIQELESLCYQFAERFDDFNETWITMDKLSVEMKDEIPNQENFLKWTRFHEARDSASVYLVAINDFRLRGTLAPFEYVIEDIRRLVWNNRRIEFLKELENGIYNEGLKQNSFKIY
ncbi:MAG: hypothetical protein JXR67_10765 [Bacteroidales bacterium]|nr:hypothetical protein [Bacteroidales bacterium]